MWRGTSSLGRATMPSGNSGSSSLMGSVYERPWSVDQPMAHEQSTAIVWFRRDLRVHDHPALHAAVAGFDRVVCAFVLDEALLDGRYRSPSRTRFMLACLEELDGALRERGGGLTLRRGRPERELPGLARETAATAVLWSGDVSPYARAR